MAKPTILLFGDSITRGAFDTERGGWADRLKSHANEVTLKQNCKPVVTVMNLGVGGQSTEDLLRRFSNEAKERFVPGDTTIVFAFGTNDMAVLMETGAYAVPLEKFERNLREMIRQARAFTNDIVFLTNVPVVERLTKNAGRTGKSRVNADMDIYNAKIKEAAAPEKLDVVDLNAVFKDYGDYEKLFAPDGVHPTSEGHRFMYEKVREYFEKKGVL